MEGGTEAPWFQRHMYRACARAAGDSVTHPPEHGVVPGTSTLVSEVGVVLSADADLAAADAADLSGPEK